MTAFILLILALSLGGAGLVVAGIFLLAGLPWALIAGGTAFVAAAVVLQRGLSNG